MAIGGEAVDEGLGLTWIINGANQRLEENEDLSEIRLFPTTKISK